MKGIAVTNPGIEDIAKLEIKELIKKNAAGHGNVLAFDGSVDDLCLLAYKAQSLTYVASLLGYFDFKSLDDLSKKASKIDVKDWLKKGTVAIRCERVGEHDFTSQDAEKVVADALFKGMRPKVDLRNPEIVILVYINNDNCHIGIDFAGFDLSKRDYKIFTHPSSIKGTIAYALVRLSGWKGKENLLDTFCGSGTIPIEAALWVSGFPLNFFKKDKFAFNKFHKFNFDKVDRKSKKKIVGKIFGYDGFLPAVNASAKNAKIGGVEKFITFSKMDVEWLDTKFDKGSVDFIVTDPPALTEENRRTMEKVYKEFFYQSEFVLKKKGKIVVITRNADIIKKYAQEHKFKLISERSVWVGKQESKVLIFTK